MNLPTVTALLSIIIFAGCSHTSTITQEESPVAQYRHSDPYVEFEHNVSAALTEMKILEGMLNPEDKIFNEAMCNALQREVYAARRLFAQYSENILEHREAEVIYTDSGQTKRAKKERVEGRNIARLHAASADKYRKYFLLIRIAYQQSKEQ